MIERLSHTGMVPGRPAFGPNIGSYAPVVDEVKNGF
jgi:hypothetical protein